MSSDSKIKIQINPPSSNDSNGHGEGVIYGGLLRRCSLAFVNIDPFNLNIGTDVYGRPQVDLGTMWNILGYGFGANTDWNAGLGSFSLSNVNSILAPGGPFSFGSFLGWPLGKKK